jgi:RNA polymerase sigma-70 factor (ECF subfamily)
MTTEERIQALLAGGDVRGATHDAIRAYGPAIHGYLHAVLRNQADAEDAYSMWAEHLYRGIGRFRGECALRTWAYKLAWNAALRLKDDPYRRRGRRLATNEVSKLAREAASSSVARRERASAALERLRAGLTPEEQTLLTLFVDRKLPWEDVAHVLSRPDAPLSAATMRKRYERLKDRLARRAREEGLVE